MENNNVKVKKSLLLLLASVVWGFSFVTQQIGGKELGPYTFNSLRMLLGALVVYIVALIFDKKRDAKPKNKAERKKLWLVGLACGVLLAIASNLQQVALNFDITTGKAGFITALYILFVPIIGLFFKNKCGWNVWVSVGIAIVGLYFLCISGTFKLQVADILLFGCAIGFACQILVIDKFAGSVDSLRLSSIEFLVTGVLTLVPALIFEVIPYAGGMSAWIMQFSGFNVWFSLLYMGMCSCGIGYTLQVVAQPGLDPTIASLIMSLESVFSLISGMVFLKQKMTGKEILGCCLMFAAICLAQISFKKKTNK